MNAQQLAQALLQIVPRASAPITAENAQATLAIYETLGAMARGELILAKSVPAEAPKV